LGGAIRLPKRYNATQLKLKSLSTMWRTTDKEEGTNKEIVSIPFPLKIFSLLTA